MSVSFFNPEENYLVTTDNSFLAPDGLYYNGAWGKVTPVAAKDFLGFDPNRNSANWGLVIDNKVFIAGCQIHYIVNCSVAPDLLTGFTEETKDRFATPRNRIYIPSMTRAAFKSAMQTPLDFLTEEYKPEVMVDPNKITRFTPIIPLTDEELNTAYDFAVNCGLSQGIKKLAEFGVIISEKISNPTLCKAMSNEMLYRAFVKANDVPTTQKFGRAKRIPIKARKPYQWNTGTYYDEVEQRQVIAPVCLKELKDVLLAYSLDYLLSLLDSVVDLGIEQGLMELDCKSIKPRFAINQDELAEVIREVIRLRNPSVADVVQASKPEPIRVERPLERVTGTDLVLLKGYFDVNDYTAISDMLDNYNLLGSDTLFYPYSRRWVEEEIKFRQADNERVTTKPSPAERPLFKLPDHKLNELRNLLSPNPLNGGSVDMVKAILSYYDVTRDIIDLPRASLIAMVHAEKTSRMLARKVKTID